MRTLGAISLVGIGGAGSASARGPPNGKGNGGPPNGNGGGPPDHAGGPPDDERGPPQHDDEDRTIKWEGQGSEHATQDCEGELGYWHWILTPGGSQEFETVGELVVTFDDDSKQGVTGYQKGNGRGAYHFDVRKSGGGTITEASVEVQGGGRNALLTISDGGCTDADVLYWQVDFGEGEVPIPPRYYPDDLMAALGNSVDGVTENPSFERYQTVGQLADVDIIGRQFTFDDENNPTEATVTFEIDEGGDTRDLHVASFRLPGEWDDEEVDDQELYDSEVVSFDGGVRGELTVDLPQ